MEKYGYFNENLEILPRMNFGYATAYHKQIELNGRKKTQIAMWPESNKVFSKFAIFKNWLLEFNFVKLLLV